MIKNKSKTRSIIVISGLIALAMIVLWAVQLQTGETSRVWRGLLIGYLFFTSVAAGLVAWPAIITTSGGDWMGSYEKIGWAGLSFSIPSLLALILLWIGSNTWVPWLEPEPHRAWWLNNNFLFARNLIMQLLFWFLALLFLKNRHKHNKNIFSSWVVFIFAITFSLVGFDLIMALEPEWKSMMIGGYFFISALYTGAAVWAFTAIIIKDKHTKALRTIGKIVFVFCLLTTYLMFSQLLPIWYENLHHETVFLIPRMNYEWLSISRLLLILIYIGPIPLLISGWAKRTPWYLGIVTLIIIIGMWIERWQLVAAVFEREDIVIGMPEIAPTLALLGLLIAGMAYAMKVIPQHLETDKQKT
jgi:hypothetical protein